MIGNGQNLRSKFVVMTKINVFIWQHGQDLKHNHLEAISALNGTQLLVYIHTIDHCARVLLWLPLNREISKAVMRARLR